MKKLFLFILIITLFISCTEKPVKTYKYRISGIKDTIYVDSILWKAHDTLHGMHDGKLIDIHSPFKIDTL